MSQISKRIEITVFQYIAILVVKYLDVYAELSHGLHRLVFQGRGFD